MGVPEPRTARRRGLPKVSQSFDATGPWVLSTRRAATNSITLPWSGRLQRGETVAALVGGMGRTLNGSYAELVAVGRSNVVSINSELPWEVLAAIPESYGTAWSSLVGILKIRAGQTILIRGATSALGQAAIQIAVDQGAQVLATTRKTERVGLLHRLGATEVFLEGPTLSERILQAHRQGTDAVLDIIGSSTLLDSLATLRRGGHVCVVGFLGGGGPLALEPVFQIPSGRLVSTFASALVTEGPDFPLAEIPFQQIADKVAAGTYQAKPARVFQFHEIQAAHHAMELGTYGGKLVVTL